MDIGSSYLPSELVAPVSTPSSLRWRRSKSASAF